MLTRNLVLLFCLIASACASASQESAQIPTLMQLPTMTPTLTATLPPSATPTLTLTATHTPSLTPSSTFTPLPTETPVMTNTPTIPPCDIDYWREEVDPVITQFLDTAEVAASTSRISLASILLELRQIYREFERLDVPDCLMEEFRDLRRGMAYAVDGFNLFLGRDEIASQVYLEFATIYLWDAYERLFQRLLFSDVRLSNAAVFIWGGPDPNPATATWLAQTSTPTPG